MASAIRLDCAMLDWWVLDSTRTANRQARAASSFHSIRARLPFIGLARTFKVTCQQTFKFDDHVPNEPLSQGVIRLSSSTALQKDRLRAVFLFVASAIRPAGLPVLQATKVAVFINP